MSHLLPLQRLRALPRLPLIGAPTPIDRQERFEWAIDSPNPVVIKRDDAFTFGSGGNKVQKFELVMANGVRKGCDAVITQGGRVFSPVLACGGERLFPLLRLGDVARPPAIMLVVSVPAALISSVSVARHKPAESLRCV